MDSPKQREIAEDTGLSLGTVNMNLKNLVSLDLVEDDGCKITDKGIKALVPYKVDNAIIMAAGLSSRFVPISYDKPKGVFKVRGEVLVERQIRQLQEAGISDITVVVGYKKEEFFYLEDMFGVDIAVNTEYSTRNNNSTIKRVEPCLGNTYICSSVNYFTENPFEQYVYQSYYSGVYSEGPTDEWCMNVKGKDNRIVDITVGGAGTWAMLGHAYWDRTFSAKFVRILDEVYDKPETAPKLWEDILRENIDSLYMTMREYPSGIIYEFDDLAQISEFDPCFIDNVDCGILDNICSVLKCERSQISGIEPIKQGLTNLSFMFYVDGTHYVYRHPGPGSDEITNRRAEAYSEKIASENGIDETFIYMDPESGWKLSYYYDGCRAVEYHDWDDVAAAMNLCRKLHSLDANCGFDFDLHSGTMRTLELLGAEHRATFKDFPDLFEMAEKFDKLAREHGAKQVLSHNDFYPPNFLISPDGRMQLIDWEYTGMSDYASDPAVFICCCEDYTLDDAMKVFELYFGRELEPEEQFHCIAYSCVVAFHWLVWALYQDAYSEPVGDLLYYYYRYTKMFGREATRLANELGYMFI